jgi:hypothetical protein
MTPAYWTPYTACGPGNRQRSADVFICTNSPISISFEVVRVVRRREESEGPPLQDLVGSPSSEVLLVSEMGHDLKMQIRDGPGGEA